MLFGCKQQRQISRFNQVEICDSLPALHSIVRLAAIAAGRWKSNAPARLRGSRQDRRTFGSSSKSGKKGKVVTVLRGLATEGNDLPDLLRQLKSACGTGGTLKDGVIELQGDHVKRATVILGEIGYRVRT
jgi:predicted translation initiation factor SUI1